MKGCGCRGIATSTGSPSAPGDRDFAPTITVCPKKAHFFKSLGLPCSLTDCSLPVRPSLNSHPHISVWKLQPACKHPASQETLQLINETLIANTSPQHRSGSCFPFPPPWHVPGLDVCALLTALPPPPGAAPSPPGVPRRAVQTHGRPGELQGDPTEGERGRRRAGEGSRGAGLAAPYQQESCRSRAQIFNKMTTGRIPSPGTPTGECDTALAQRPCVCCPSLATVQLQSTAPVCPPRSALPPVPPSTHTLPAPLRTPAHSHVHLCTCAAVDTQGQLQACTARFAKKFLEMPLFRGSAQGGKLPSRVSLESQGLEAAPAIAGMSQPYQTAVFALSLCPWVLQDVTTLLSRPRQQGGGSPKAAVPAGGPSAGFIINTSLPANSAPPEELCRAIVLAAFNRRKTDAVSWSWIIPSFG